VITKYKGRGFVTLKNLLYRVFHDLWTLLQEVIS